MKRILPTGAVLFHSYTHKIKFILEIKSTGRIPDRAYSSWWSQLYLQMGGLAEQHPEYSIKGAILTLDLAHGEVGFFNGYEPEEMIYSGLLERARTTWSHYHAMLQGMEPEMKTEQCEVFACPCSRSSGDRRGNRFLCRLRIA